MFGLSWWHILLVLVVFVLLFGAGRISGLMGDVAKGLRSFKKGLADEDEEAPPEPRLVERRRAETNQDSQHTGSKAPKRTRKTA
jgi:sec-independent protein translocase protein TatA